MTDRSIGPLAVVDAGPVAGTLTWSDKEISHDTGNQEE
jgi:hypothetical protein